MNPKTDAAKVTPERMAEIRRHFQQEGTLTHKTPGMVRDLLAYISGLEADKKRLDWLDGESVSGIIDRGEKKWTVNFGHDEANIRDGIDAAMGAPNR